MDNKKRLCLEDAVTNAEIYAVKVIEEELNRKGIAPNSIERKIIITRTADVLAASRLKQLQTWTVSWHRSEVSILTSE